MGKIKEEVTSETVEQPKSKKKMIVVSISILLLVLLQDIAMIVLYEGALRSVFVQEEASDTEDVQEVEESLVYPIEQLVVNLSSKTGKNHYLKITPNLVYADAELESVIADNSTKIQDTIISVIGIKSLNEVNSIENSNLLKEEIRSALNELLESDVFIDIYFTHYLYN